MRRSEKGWLAVGVLAGFVIAGLAYVFFPAVGAVYDRPRPHRAPLQEEAEPQDSVPPLDTPVAVQLSDEEQKSIGIETVEVRRRTIRKEISAPGRVAEPETGVGAISARIGGRVDRL